MSLFSKRKQESGWLVTQFAADGVRMAYVVRLRDNKPRVAACAVYHLDPAALHALEKLGKDMQLARHHVGFVLNFAQYQMLVAEAPNVPAAELKTAMRWRIKDMLDFPVSDATLDVFEIPGEKNAPVRSRSMYVVAARNDLIRGRMESFQAAKWPVSVIDIPEMAQRNIAALLEEPGRGLALLSFTEEGGLLTFTYQGELYASRHIEIALSQLVEADSETRQRHFDRITLELQRSLDHFERQFHFIALARLMVAPLPPEVNLDAYLTSNLYLPVATLNLDDVFDFSTVSGVGLAQRMLCFQVLGAALRIEDAAP